MPRNKHTRCQTLCEELSQGCQVLSQSKFRFCCESYLRCNIGFHVIQLHAQMKSILEVESWFLVDFTSFFFFLITFNFRFSLQMCTSERFSLQGLAPASSKQLLLVTSYYPGSECQADFLCGLVQLSSWENLELLSLIDGLPQ